MTIDEVHEVCVVGAGTMGSQIAHLVALAGYPVRLYSRTRERLEATVPAARAVLRKRVDKGKLAADEYEAAVARVCPTTDLRAAASGAQFVIKTVAEDRDVKRTIFGELDAACAPDTILASNSSTMPSSFFADCVTNPARLLNVHFFNPALAMQLVEVVQGPHTADETVTCAMAFARRIGRTPVLVRKEAYGFIVNRILFIAMQEAFRLVESGVVSREDCDLAVRNGLNWPMGPFALADLVGLDVTADILAQGEAQTGEERWRPTPLLRSLVESGRLGRKTGEGFFTYGG